MLLPCNLLEISQNNGDTCLAHGGEWKRLWHMDSHTDMDDGTWINASIRIGAY